MKNSSASGIILYAKQPGMTSFSSLGVIKKALRTGKVGHTGTLDSFAEGLLVVLVGGMTRLVPHITSADKAYLAVVSFGKETDTLELTGSVVAVAPVPTRQQILDVLPQFSGRIQQVPPLYSALHVDGRRASDIARSGKNIDMPSRPVTIHSIELLDYSCTDGTALLKVRCSKGTYIRSLARDIAIAAGSRGHLVALRRTSVGPFSLDNAVFAERLGSFGLESRGVAETTLDLYPNKDLDRVASSLMPFDADMATKCELPPVFLEEEYEPDFFVGRPPADAWFGGACPSGMDCAVFTSGGCFAGLVRREEKRIRYGFVVPKGGM